MKCFRCNKEMKCTHWISNEGKIEVSWFRCENCYSESEIAYDTATGKIDEVIWRK